MDVWICYASTSQEEKEEEILTGLVYIQGIPQQSGTGHFIARLIAFSSSYFIFKNENVKVKVKYDLLCFVYWFIFCNLNYSNWESKERGKNENFGNFA